MKWVQDIVISYCFSVIPEHKKDKRPPLPRELEVLDPSLDVLMTVYTNILNASKTFLHPT